MNCNTRQRYKLSAKLWQACLLVGCLALGACASNPALRPMRFDDSGQAPVLAYYQMLAKMSPAELGRERSVLAALSPTPNTHLRLAMLLGHPRAPQDIGKAIALLDGILKASDAPAVSLHPLARLLADNYLERQRQDSQLDRQTGQLERQAAQLKDSQRKTVELQEKIDGLADIERTLPQRSRQLRSAPIRGAK